MTPQPSRRRDDDPTRVSRRWLALREPADAAARARDLVERLAAPTSGHWVIHDLGCGSGSMGRWLAPLLSWPQHWVGHERDADLLEAFLANPPGPDADGAAVTVQPRRSDVARLDPSDLAGASLITASALLDMLTADELAAMVTVGVGLGCPVLLTLSVSGHVSLSPPDPLDGPLAAAFNAHQRRETPRGRLLGPDAVPFAEETFGRLGAEVIIRPSPWRLRAAQSALATEWVTGWVAAACEQRPQLDSEAERYLGRRLAQLSAGTLAVTVGHADLLALPRRPRG
jgi:hypothetical protein